MTRWTVLALLALNLGLAAWNVSTLSAWGIGPRQDTGRLNPPVRPQAIRIGPPEASAASAPPSPSP